MEHNIIDIPLDQYIKHNTRCSRKHNSQFLQIRHSSNTFGHSFFSLLDSRAKEWNALPSNIISSNSIESFQKNLKQISDRPLADKPPCALGVMCPKGIICQYVNRNRNTACYENPIVPVMTSGLCHYHGTSVQGVTTGAAFLDERLLQLNDGSIGCEYTKHRRR